ncbi:MAG: hypothetical protein DYG89_13405 [Caldilinea sp. CFX5]|nr:hypothetical protein [Caldilinea sp. CFX5]
MIAFQFPTQITTNGDLAIPSQYRQSIPAGSQLQIVLLVEAPTEQAQETVDETNSLEEYTAFLRSRPLPASLITPSSGLLREHLANPQQDPDPNFSERAWNQQWDKIEAEMNADEEIDEQMRLDALRRDLGQ